MTNRAIAIFGAGLLIAGLFLPMVSVPLLGSISFFGNGQNVTAYVIIGLAVLSIGLAGIKAVPQVLWLGLAACGVLLYSYGKMQFGLSEMRGSLAELEGNPFAGIAEAAVGSVQIQWGWIAMAAGAVLTVYAAVAESNAVPMRPVALSRPLAGFVLVASIVAVLAPVGLDIFPRSSLDTSPRNASAVAAEDVATVAATPGADASADRTQAEKAAYIGQHLELYELKADYYDSLLDGRVPGVQFKIKNKGSRTLHEVKVRVVFKDASNQPIAEEEYFPVLVSSFSVGNDAPLRPNYIWQQESGKFYAAKGVPSEWDAGNVTATIIDVEFAPTE